MKCEKIDLYSYFKLNRNGATGGYLTVYLRTYITEIKHKLRPAMLVIPGGGYDVLSEREAEPVALEYLLKGYSSFVLSYSVKTAYPVPLNEACMAVLYLRENAQKLEIDREQIAAIGFSAGGHLAGMLATLKDSETKIFATKADAVRPNAVVLSYPVVTMKDNLTHCGTRDNISANGAISYKILSVEERVDKKSSPAFIWHTVEDDHVPVENSLYLASAYRKANVPFSLHLFEKGRHGLCLCNDEVFDQPDKELEHIGEWFNLSCNWLKSHGFKSKVKE